MGNNSQKPIIWHWKNRYMRENIKKTKKHHKILKKNKKNKKRYCKIHKKRLLYCIEDFLSFE